MSKDDQILEDFTSQEYEHGWSVDLESDQAPKGLNEDIVRFIMDIKQERNTTVVLVDEVRDLCN